MNITPRRVYTIACDPKQFRWSFGMAHTSKISDATFDEIRRYAAMKERGKIVDVEQVIQTLRTKRNDNPPDPWDIVPDDLNDFVAELRAR